MLALYTFGSLLLAARPAAADDRIYRGKNFEGVYYDPADIDWFFSSTTPMKLTLREDGTYEWAMAEICGAWDVTIGVWTDLGSGFLIEDFAPSAPMVGRFRGSRASGLYLDPEGEWIGWTLHEPASKPWPAGETILWGERLDGSKLRIELQEDGSCIHKEHNVSCTPSPGRYCTWSVDPITRLPLIESDTRLIPSPIPEPGCFHLDDGGLGVDVCAY